jgi:hypothetical protein
MHSFVLHKFQNRFLISPGNWQEQDPASQLQVIAAVLKMAKQVVTARLPESQDQQVFVAVR